MSTEILVRLSSGMGLTATDMAAIAITLLLIINAIARARRTRQHTPGLLRANLAMVVAMVCSISVIYETIDPLLGGRSLLNCFTHLLCVYVGWEIATSTAKMLQQFDEEETTTWLIRPWVPIASAIGVVATYLILDPISSRGLDDYDQELVYVLYWLATVAPLALAAFHIVPRFTRIYSLLKYAHWLTRASVTLLWLSFIGVPLSVVGWAITAVAPEFYVVREVIVNGTLLLFATAFLMATAALPRPQEKQSLRYCPTQTQAEPQ